MLAAQMQQMLDHGMVPLVMPDDPHLTGFIHQAGSALFFGCTLGVLNALTAMVLSVIPWIHRGFSRFDIITYILLGSLFTYMSFSAEMPAISVAFGFICPLAFFIPWACIIRKSSEQRINFRGWIVMTLVTALPFVSLVALMDSSFEIIRDSMLEIPVARSLSDFYYDHTYLAAHVIKPVSSQEQKVIAIAEDIKRIGPMPHGTLWIRCADPCSVAGRTVAVSRKKLGCESVVIDDDKPANTSNRIIKHLSTTCDYNKRMRSGIGLFFYGGPLFVIPLLFMLWLAYGLSRLYQEHKIMAVIVIMAYLALFSGSFRTAFLQHQLVNHKDRIHEYILSENENKRYLALKTFPGEIRDSELRRFSHDDSARIRLSALYEAGMRKDPAFMDIFEQGLSDPQINVRTRACLALGALGSQEALNLLENVLCNDPCWYVRGYAYRAIGRIRPVAHKVFVESSSGS